MATAGGAEGKSDVSPHPKSVDHGQSPKYSATLAELEELAHVRVEDQVAEQPEAPAESPLTQGEVERQIFLRTAGAP